MYDGSDGGVRGPGHQVGSPALLCTPHHYTAVTLACLTPVSQHSTLSLVTQGFLSWLSFTGSLGGVQVERMSLGAKQAFGCICVVGLGPRPIRSELGSPQPTTDILLALFVIWTKGHSENYPCLLFFKYFVSTPLLKDKRKKKKRVFLVYKNLAISTFFSEPCFQCSSWSWIIQTTTDSERRRFWHQVNVTYPVTGNFRHSQKYREQSHFYDMDI